jgi:peptide-methionine (S)-S-oxide reductase
MLFMRKTTTLPSAAEALPGRSTPIPTAPRHFVNGHPLQPPYPAGLEKAVFGLGCFWGAERKFWTAEGVYTTAVGYAGGFTPNPTYEEVCSGRTGHTEVVLVVFDPKLTSVEAMLRVFWENHDPTQGMRQGNDVGTQYRSAIFYTDEEQREVAEAYVKQLDQAHIFPRPIVTQIVPLEHFFAGEEYHQDYAIKNPQNPYIQVCDIPKIAELERQFPALFQDYQP